MRRLAYGVIIVFLSGWAPLQAQDSPSGDLKAKIARLKGEIFDAHMTQQTFANGLPYCSELDGKRFFHQLRKRILDLEEYFRALENLVKAQIYNPEKRRPWTIEDAKERWAEVKKQAQEDKQKCELVQSLPELEKRLQVLEALQAQQQNTDSDKFDHKE